MPVFLIITIVLLSGLISSALKAIKQKNYRDLVSVLLLLPFFIFFVITAMLGGSAFNQAQTSYEHYQAGHYYLMSHGNYTEVTYAQYLVAKISEVVGLGSLALCLLLTMIRRKK